MSVDNFLDYSILFVEDERGLRKNYVSYLKRYFKSVYEASNGIEGLEVYKTKKPDILIVDLSMPQMNGLEMLQKIRKNDHTTRAVVLTAHSESDFLLQAAELKLTKYLLKPITRDELKDMLMLTIEEIKSFSIKSNRVTTLKMNYSWSHENKELFHNNVIIPITPIERKILDLLFTNPGQTLNGDDIIVYAWDTLDNDKQVALKNAVRKLRTKLPPNTLINVYGEGFKLVI